MDEIVERKIIRVPEGIVLYSNVTRSFVVFQARSGHLRLPRRGSVWRGLQLGHRAQTPGLCRQSWALEERRRRRDARQEARTFGMPDPRAYTKPRSRGLRRSGAVAPGILHFVAEPNDERRCMDCQGNLVSAHRQT